MKNLRGIRTGQTSEGPWRFRGDCLNMEKEMINSMIVLDVRMDAEQRVCF